ncbi:MAG: FapA family protein [Gemmatimonadales bacterium]|nr:FapA family protein [Gemmatimonadales bacterium]
MAITAKPDLKDLPDSCSNLEEAAELAGGVEDLMGGAVATGGPEYELRVSEDRISLLLDCQDPLGDIQATISHLMDDFEKLGLPEFPDPETLSEILKQACGPGEHLVGHTLIQGWAPTTSVDGRMEWACDFFDEEIAEENEGGEEESGASENEAVDFWDQNDQRSVNKDDLLARVHHAIAGEPGLDVFSCEIPIIKPESIKLRPGKGVKEVDEGDSSAYYADLPGRIRYQEGTVFVDDVYLVKGDVSLETGNIVHSGTVNIEGDVKSGATIQADGDITVKGMLEPCHIQCGGSLTVGGGIVGMEEFMIQVEGDVQAMYIKSAVVRSGGDITVTNEIEHCDIKVFGKVMVPTGRLAGGQTIARVGIQVAEAGASGSTDTLLAVGIDFTVDKRVIEGEARIEKLEDAQHKIKEALSKAAAVKTSPAGSENTLFVELGEKSKKIGEAIIKEHMAIKTDLQNSTRATREEVTVFRQVWSGTTIQIGDYKTLIRSSVEKPRIARLIRGKVQVLPLGEGNMPKS